MKKRKKPTILYLATLFIVLVLSTVLSGCGNRNKELEGMWQVISATHEDLDGNITDLATIGTMPVHNATFIFSDNLSVYSESGDVSNWSYKYKDNVLELKTEGDAGIYTCECTGDRLILTSFTMQSVGDDGGGTDELRIELVKQ